MLCETICSGWLHTCLCMTPFRFYTTPFWPIKTSLPWLEREVLAVNHICVKTILFKGGESEGGREKGRGQSDVFFFLSFFIVYKSRSLKPLYAPFLHNSSLACITFDKKEEINVKQWWYYVFQEVPLDSFLSPVRCDHILNSLLMLTVETITALFLLLGRANGVCLCAVTLMRPKCKWDSLAFPARGGYLQTSLWVRLANREPWLKRY